MNSTCFIFLSSCKLLWMSTLAVMDNMGLQLCYELCITKYFLPFNAKQKRGFCFGFNLLYFPAGQPEVERRRSEEMEASVGVRLLCFFGSKHHWHPSFVSVFISPIDQITLLQEVQTTGEEEVKEDNSQKKESERQAEKESGERTNTNSAYCVSSWVTEK